jgi:hypothetical protein
MNEILKCLELPIMEQIITGQTLRLLEKVALMPAGLLTQEVLRSQAKPVGQSKRGKGDVVVRPRTKSCTKATGLL